MPDHVSHYRIDAEIGRVGMGVVDSAHDTRLGRAVAIKTLPPQVTADPERHRRFIQEARAASALNHANIVTIHEIDEDNGTTFIAMELVDGTRLDTLIAQGSLAVAKALEYDGKHDFQNPPASPARLLELLGTPPDKKKLVTLEGGHVPNDMLGVIRHVLDWYDTYLGPVR